MSTAASDTLALLERRLARLEFQLGTDPGASSADKSKNGVASAKESVTGHLARLDSRLMDLCARNAQAADVLRLYERNLEVSSLLDQSHIDTQTHGDRHQAANVLVAGALFPQTLSDLSALEGQQVPDARQLATLVSLQPRLANAQAVQQVQSEQENELHLRSAKLLSRWYEKSVIRQGEQWAEWEERLSNAEKRVRQRENAKRREDEGI